MPMIDRQEIRFRSQDADCAAWLYTSGSEARPCVVLAHGFAGVRDQRLDDYAERFRKCGWNAFVFDYRCFGNSDGTPRQLVSNRAQVEDWQAAVRYVRALEQVDPEKLVLWGTSTSGGHVVKVAARDRRIAAVVVQMPFASGFAQLRMMHPTQGLRLLWAGLRDQIGSWFGRKPLLVPVAGRPYTSGVITTPDSLTGLALITGAGSTWRNWVVARFALSTAFYNPGRDAVRIACPLLVCVADGDALIARKPALRLARRGELRRYGCTHFEMYHGAGFERAVDDQISFLRRSLDGVAA
jgi:alpha-beta hydrolase superfamily lysophospholipase